MTILIIVGICILVKKIHGGNMSMKSLKQEVIYIVFIFVIQIAVSFLITNYLLNERWSLKGMLCNPCFIIFWCTYAVCVIGIRSIKSKLEKRV